MKLLEIKVQGEDIDGVRRLRLLPGTTAAELKRLARFLRRHDTDNALLLFPENAAQPLDDECILDTVQGDPLSVHLHRSRQVALTCKGDGWAWTTLLSPATSFGRIAGLLAEQGRFDARAERTLLITGTQTVPAAHIHLGTYVLFPFCHLTLDVRG